MIKLKPSILTDLILIFLLIYLLQLIDWSFMNGLPIFFTELSNEINNLPTFIKNYFRFLIFSSVFSILLVAYYRGIKNEKI